MWKPATGPAKVLNAMLASYGIMPTVRTFNNSMYDRLGESPSKSGVWKCLACDNLNLTTNSLRSLDSYETSNPYEPLDTSNHSIISFSRKQTSTPKSKQQHSSSKNPLTKQKKNKIKRSVKVLAVNCRSIVDKKKEYGNLMLLLTLNLG